MPTTLPTSTAVGADPVLHDPSGPRRGYRDWTIAHGRPWDYFDTDPIDGTCTVVVLDGWWLVVKPMRGQESVRVSLTKAPAKWWASRIKHDLHRRVFDDVAAAHRALFDAGVIAVRVYEDQTVWVQAFTRVGRGYDSLSRISVLNWRVPPAADRMAPVREAYAISLPATAQQPHHDPVTAQAIRYQHQGYPELAAGDLVAVDGRLYEMSTDSDWREVTAADWARTYQRRTVETDEVAAVESWNIADSHHIEAAAKVYLTVGDHGWQVDFTSVDGHALDLVDEDARYDNDECGVRMRDEECDPSSHRMAVSEIYETLPIPSGAELVPLLGAAVLGIGNARRDHANADLLRLYSHALHTVDRELGDLVLRAVFGRQLAEPQAATRFSTASDGSWIVRLSAEAHAVIAALTAPSTAVNHEGVMYSDAAHAELAELFPIADFWAWVSEADVTDEDDVRYFADAGK
ncbi:hypothetical protein C8D87_11489 [Lentzea atacamensis]|uniref:Uncharacterized protein n=1 Tax=Lentzea atacamensis TaxID=531938 RepID=A0ABX9DZ39_9PSEU|nr:hypothetical protein [Lentzea atacamensis]RAS59477.1 hypothetical protein C8D87_11489 [Lentzea atacamensis]